MTNNHKKMNKEINVEYPLLSNGVRNFIIAREARK